MHTDIFLTPKTNPNFFSGLLGGDGDLSTSEWIDWSIGNGTPLKTFGGNDIVFSTCIGHLGIAANWFEGMRITENGNVGIGTASPESNLHVVDEVNTGTAIILDRYVDNSDSSEYRARKARGTQDVPTAVMLNDGLGGIEMEGYDGTLFKDVASVSAHVDGVVSSGVIPGRLTFKTSNESDIEPEERMRIDHNGNVGIGTTSPQGKIHIHDGNGGFLFWTFDGIGDNAQTIIPDGTGDIKNIARFEGVFIRDGTSFIFGPILIKPGNRAFPTSGLTISVDADGSATIQRTSGSLNYNIAMRVIWL
jgi:hypothetical protein